MAGSIKKFRSLIIEIFIYITQSSHVVNFRLVFFIYFNRLLFLFF